MENHVHLLVVQGQERALAKGGEEEIIWEVSLCFLKGVMKVGNLLQADEGLVEKVEMIEKKLIRNRKKNYLITNA